MCKRIVLLVLLLAKSLSAEKSLAIVLDTTKSMKDEINIIKSSIGNVLRNLSETFYSEYVLVGFKDTVVEQPYITQTIQDYTNYINLINPSEGHDCPENSLSGIESALRNTKDESSIFLFTDAFASDFSNFLTVQDLCRKTHSQVTIFLSGFCLPSERSSTGSFDVYYDIAKACSGSFVLFDTAFELRQAFRFIKEMAGVDWTEITVTDKYSGHKQFNHNIEPFTTDFVIAISGKYAQVDVYISNQAQRYEKLVETRHSMVIRIVQPLAGHYTVNVRAEGAIAATFYERNYIPFQYGFSVRRPESLRETTSRPIAGRTNYILVTMDTSIKLIEIEWLTYGSNEKKILYLEEIKSGFYVCSILVDPDKAFKFWVIGRDRSTSQSVKGSTKVIYPQMPVSNAEWTHPRAEILSLESNLIGYRDSLTLICRVHGYPKPTVVWEDENRNSFQSEEVILEVPYTHLSYMNIQNVVKNNTIYCKATNAKGEHSDSVEIFVNRTFSFEVIKSPEDTTVEYGEQLKLYCEVDAYPEATVKWYRNDTEVSQISDIELNKEENSLIVNNFDLDDVGQYKCEATNEVETKEFSANVEISGIDTPTAEVESTEVILKPGDFKQVRCTSSGKPDPIITWKFKSSQTREFSYLPQGVEDDDGVLKFDSVAKQHEGVYRCIATNIIDEDSKDVIVKIQYAPKIKSNAPERMTVREGDVVELPCEVEAIPEAAVRWEMSQDDLIIVLDNRHRTDKMNTHHFTALYNDSGYYHCIAENNIGKTEKTIFVNVLVPPYIDPPETEMVLATRGSNIDLQCNVSHGNPAPTTQWEFIGPDLVPKILQRGNSKNPLRISNVSRRHEGTYLCIAENEVNTDRIRYHLKIK